MKEFEQKAEQFSLLIKGIFPRSIVVLRDEESTSITCEGTPFELLSMTKALVGTIRKSMEEDLPKPLVKELLRSIIMTDAEMKEEIKAMKEKKEKREKREKNENEIPDWLKNLMKKEMDDEDEDSVSDSDSDDDDEEDSAEERLNRLADALRDVCCTRSDCPVCGDDLRDEDRG